MKKLIYIQILVSLASLVTFFGAWRVTGSAHSAFPITIFAATAAITIATIATAATAVALATTAFTTIIATFATLATAFATVIFFAVPLVINATTTALAITATSKTNRRHLCCQIVAAVLVQFGVIYGAMAGARKGLSAQSVIPVLAVFALAGALLVPSVIWSIQRLRLRNEKSRLAKEEESLKKGLSELRPHFFYRSLPLGFYKRTDRLGAVSARLRSIEQQLSA